MTEYEALDLTYEVWQYIESEGLIDMYDLPDTLYAKIKDLYSQCPLCEYYQTEQDDYPYAECNNCPLNLAGQCCLNDDSAFEQWELNEDPSGAADIVAIVSKAWREHKDHKPGPLKEGKK